MILCNSCFRKSVPDIEIYVKLFLKKKKKLNINSIAKSENITDVKMDYKIFTDLIKLLRNIIKKI